MTSPRTTFTVAGYTATILTRSPLAVAYAAALAARGTDAEEEACLRLLCARYTDEDDDMPQDEAVDWDIADLIEEANRDGREITRREALLALAFGSPEREEECFHKAEASWSISKNVPTNPQAFIADAYQWALCIYDGDDGAVEAAIADEGGPRWHGLAIMMYG